MPDQDRTDIAGKTNLAGTDRARAASRSALIIGLLLGAGLLTAAQAAFPALMAFVRKDEDRLAATAAAKADDAAACTALAQDRATGSTVALDCGRAVPEPAQRPSREIES